MSWFALLFFAMGAYAVTTGKAYYRQIIYREEHPVLFKIITAFYFFMGGAVLIAATPLKDDPTCRGLFDLAFHVGPLVVALCLAVYTHHCHKTGKSFWYSTVYRAESPKMFNFCQICNGGAAVVMFLIGFVAVLKFAMGHRLLP